jgi:hypothetical protein
MEDTTHPHINIKKFKEMVKAPKQMKNNQKQRFGFQDFVISRDYGLLFGSEGCGIIEGRHHH